MAKTLVEPTADEQVIATYNRGMRAADAVPLELNTKYALVLLKLNPAVTHANYPAIGAAINAVAGIDGVNLVIDHQTRADIPADHTIKAIVECSIRIDPIPPEPQG